MLVIKLKSDHNTTISMSIPNCKELIRVLPNLIQNRYFTITSINTYYYDKSDMTDDIISDIYVLLNMINKLHK